MVYAKDSGTRWSFEYWEFLVREVKKRNVALSKKKARVMKMLICF